MVQERCQWRVDQAEWGEKVSDLDVIVVVIEGGRILLTKREDAEIWCLPGGSVEAGESLARAAVREVREETGLEIVLTHLVGVYSRPGYDNHQIAFAARVVGGTPRPQVGEVIDLGYFDFEELPSLLPWHRQPIRDANAGVGGSAAWTLDFLNPFPGLSRSEVYALRDQSGLGRAEFFTKHIDNPGLNGDRREV